tara:strand:- start:471 stop:1706 length:1236 start_codon:yes stop_codon:yes gene_type:complete
MSRSTKIMTILTGTAWVSVYTGLYRLMTLLVSIMAARLLDVVDYGKVSILQSTAALFIMFATMGLGTVATKLVAESNQKYIKSITFINFVLCLSAAIGLFLGANWIALEVYQDASLSILIEFLSAYIFFSGITQIQSSILAGKEDYAKIAKVNLYSGILSIVIVFLAIKQFGVAGWLLGLSALEIGKAIVLQLIIRKMYTSVPQRMSKKIFFHVSKLALPIALSGFFILPINWFLTKELLLKNGYLDVAVMNISDQWVAILTFFPIAIGNAMLPIMSKMRASAERKDMSDLALKINILFSTLICIPVVLVGEFVLKLYGDSYTQHANIFYYIAPLVIILSLTNQLNNRVIADGRPALMMYSNLLWSVVCLPVSFYLIKAKLGVVAILIGRLVAYLVKLLFLYSYTRREPAA